MSSGQSFVMAGRPMEGNKIWGRHVAFDLLQTLRPTPAVGRWLSIAISVAVTALVVYALRGADWTAIWPALTSSGLFWVVFAANYVHAPAAEALIFGRLWNTTDGLFSALCRKQIVNALLVSYAGDALLLDWAHRRGIAAFSGIKDAAILAGLAGGVATFLLVLPVWTPLSAALGLAPSSLLVSIGILAALPLAALARRDMIFGSSGGELFRIGAIHAARVLANIVLLSLCWHLLLPSAPLASWLMLAAARMVVSRLPLVPNKEIAAAAVAVAMLPGTPEVAGVIAATGVLITLAHAAVWIGQAAFDVARIRTARVLA
jgi:hypothetical protein